MNLLQTVEKKLRVLLVDDDEGDAFLIRDYLEDGVLFQNLELEHVLSFDQALESLEKNELDLCLFDFRLGARTGIELIEAAHEMGVHLPILLLTGQGDEETAVAALRAGATDYLRKEHLSTELLTSAIRHALDLHHKEQQRKQAQEALVREKEFVSAVLQNSFDGIAVANKKGVFKMVNPGMERLSGYTTDELKSIENWVCMAVDSAAQRIDAMKDWEQDIRSGMPAERIFLLKHKNGTNRWCRFQIAPMPNGDVVLNCQDITASKEAEQHIQHLAMHDALTDLPSRRLFQDRLEQALITATRNSGMLALLFVDLDKFKHINDTHGHETGDLVLVETADRLRNCVRASDTVARIGGDEFVIVLTGVKRTEAASCVCEKVISAITSPFHAHGLEHTIGVSVGISIFPQDGKDLDTLLNNADKAMYAAKNAGGNRFQYYKMSAV